MSQERQSSNDSSNDLIQSFYSLNLDQDSDQINLNGLNLNESNSDINISIENNDSSVIDLSDNNQNVFFHPSFFRINTTLQLNQTYSQDTIEFNNTFDYNDQPNQTINDQLSDIKNPFNKTSFNWDLYNNRNQVLKELRKDKKFVDLQLIAEDGYSEYVHSTVISALGKNLANFIFSVKDEPNTPCSLIDDSDHNFKNHVKKIYLEGISGSVLKVIIDCAYTGYFETDDKQIVWSIINVAERFSMNDILKASLTYLIYQLNVDNCIKLLHLGIKFKHKLRTAAWNFIRLKFDRIVNECSDYVNLTIDELINLLEDDHLNAISGEQIVWEGIRRWILADLINRTKYLNKLLEKLRFGRLQLEYLEEVILKDPLLTEINNGSFNELNIKNEELNLTKSIASKDIVSFKKNKKIYSNFINRKLNNSQSSSSSALSFNDTNKCLNLIKRMICIRKNKQNQYKTDNYNLLIDLNPYFVRPRVPAEVIFVIGGWQDNAITTLIETYDVRTNMWLESFISLEYTRAYHGLEILNGLLYVIGGTNGNKTLSSMHCFNPNNGKWYERANMHERRCYVNTTILNGLIYAMGGHNGAQRLDTVEKYDYKINQWTIVSPMNLARSDASAATYDNKIYIAGGLNEHVQNTVEFFNPTDNTWTFLQPMRFQRNSLSLVLFNNCLYALGGTNGTSRLNSVERYDFSSEKWELAKPMRCSRSTFKACVLEDRLYVVGGHDQNSQIKSVEYYDIQKDEWFEVKSLKRSRSGMAICSYRSFTVSNKYTYNYYAEQQIAKTKKKIFKKKESKSIKNNEQLIEQSSDNHRVKETNLNATINRFRRRRTQLKLNSTNLVERSLITTNQISSNNINNQNSNQNSNRNSLESVDLFVNSLNEQQPSTSRSNNQNQSDNNNNNSNNYHIQKHNSQQNQQQIHPSTSGVYRINSIVTDHNDSSSDIQMPSFQIKIRSYENTSKINRIFQTRSLNNDRLIDRENEESSADDWDEF